MKLTLIFFSILTALSLWFRAQGLPPATCGKPIPLRLLPMPGVKVTTFAMPLRFGGTRAFPYLQYPSDKPFRRIISNKEQFSEFWKPYTVVPPGNWVPPIPEIDFSREMVIVAAMGQRPSPGFVVMIDGACELDDQIQVFITSVTDGPCVATLGVVTSPADAVVLRRSDLPIVFQETHVPCTEWQNRLLHLKNQPRIIANENE